MVASALRRADRPAAPPLDLWALLLALPALGLARLLPADGPGLYLRLAAATAVVLLPGFLLARALGRRSASAGLVLALALLFAALAATFALNASLVLTGLVLVAAGAAALPFAVRRAFPSAEGGAGAVLPLGILFGLALWHVARPPAGDGLFHLARVRKLVAFDELSLSAVGEFADGGLHPGYAFPLWHGLLALVAELAAVDPADVLAHEASVLAPLAFVVAYEAGVAVFASRRLGAAVLAAHVALVSLAAGHGGALASLAQPGAAARLLLVPAAIALVLSWTRAPAWDLLLAVAASGLMLAVVHPTYALFLALPLGGFVVARALLGPQDVPRLLAAVAAFLVPAGAFFAWLLPVVRATASYSPGAGELDRALTRYAASLDVVGESTYRLAPELLSRRGSVAVAALALVPLAALAPRRRFSAFVLGGTLAVLVVLLVPELFTRLSDAVSISQSRRAAAFVPAAFAFAAGAAVLARLLGRAVLPLALAAGIALQLAYPGDFTIHLDEGGGPAPVVWFAALAGAIALAAAAAAAARGRGLDLNGSALALSAALLFVLPVAVHAATRWSPVEDRTPRLTAGLVAALAERVPERAVVFSDLETSYRVAAYAPVYVAAAPPAHVADTTENDPYRRRRDVLSFFRTGDLAIPRSYGARWLVVDRTNFGVRPELPVVYADPRYLLYRLQRRGTPGSPP
jgi:hypothetical protein